MELPCIAMHGVSLCVYSLYVYIMESRRKICLTEIVVFEISRKLMSINKIKPWMASFCYFFLLVQLAVYSPALVMKIDFRNGERGRNVEACF